MMLFWKIRYLDCADRQFKDRCLYLNTKSLDPVTHVAVELVAENKSSKTEREILKYRHLFTEDKSGTGPRGRHEPDYFKGFCLSDYFEDETGKEMALHEMGPILTGDPTARLFPRGARRHDIDFMLADPKPIPVAEVSLSSEETRLLGYFARDLQELLDSAFMKDGPGTLSTGSGIPSLETAVTDDEIRSFVTIFRRLYMEKEPANFQKAVAVFAKALGDHPYAKWVAGVASEFQSHLAAVVDPRPFIQTITCTFTTKRLIDVFLYTQYAHQPDEKRQPQFTDCLNEVHGQRVLLTWLFLTEIWRCGLEIGNAGNAVSWWFKHFCDHHGVLPDVLNSLRDDHSGLGVAEKEEHRQARLFREKAEELAMELWKQAGRPEGGPNQFLVTAREQLAKRLQG
ncbi:MAG TPA: hypothetical protein VH682_20090 [Gemmataceae bacterium]|jgi:hypothetical protein